MRAVTFRYATDAAILRYSPQSVLHAAALKETRRTLNAAGKLFGVRPNILLPLTADPMLVL